MSDINFEHFEENVNRISDERLKAVALFIYDHKESFDYGMIAEFINNSKTLPSIKRQRVSNLTKSLTKNFGFNFKAPLNRGGSYQLVGVSAMPLSRTEKNKSEEESQEFFRVAFSLMGGVE